MVGYTDEAQKLYRQRKPWSRGLDMTKRGVILDNVKTNEGAVVVDWGNGNVEHISADLIAEKSP